MPIAKNWREVLSVMGAPVADYLYSNDGILLTSNDNINLEAA